MYIATRNKEIKKFAELVTTNSALASFNEFTF